MTMPMMSSCFVTPSGNVRCLRSCASHVTEEEAVKYLSGYGVYGNREEFPMPGIVLLDLKMPGVDGYAVLRWIRRQPALANLPVVVFTGSDAGAAEALEKGADCYMRKGVDTDELLALLQQVNLGWQRNSNVTWLNQPDPHTAGLGGADRFQGFQFAS